MEILLNGHKKEDKIMKLDTLKKYVVILSLGFILSSNFIFASVEVDTTAPVITIIGEKDISLTVGNTYIDKGVTALDDADGDITSLVTTENNLDVNKAGTYTYKYNVKDSAGNSASEIVRNITVSEVIPPKILTEKFIIRTGDTVLWEGNIDLPSAGTYKIIDKEIDSRSVLAILSSIDKVNDSFEITDLPYSESLGSFYIKCITPKDKTPLCDNWQYAVGAVTPWTAIDKTILSGGETIGIYFGTSHRVVLDKNDLIVGGTLLATSEKYNYEENIWDALTGVNIGLTLPNVDDIWTPIVVNTFPVDENGKAEITIDSANEYGLGIVEDYYFPSYKIIVTEASNGGGHSGSNSSKSFSTESAFSFLKSQQKNDSSFGDALYTDWVAIAAKAGDDAYLKSSLAEYFKNNNFNLSAITDYERHAMALMSLGINPYNGTTVDYIKKITNSFDGNQIGDKSLFNDDIFGLIVLQKAGYDENDEIINKTISFIISKQFSDGSWDSVDMTSAGIMALDEFKNIDGVSDSIDKAENFLNQSQMPDGGFENSSSTSWAIQSLSLNSSNGAKVDDGIKYLSDKQQDDGGLDGPDLNSRVWITAYAITAVLKLSWIDVLESFDRVEKTNNSKDAEENILVEEPVITPELIVLGITNELPIVQSEVKIKPIVKVNLNKKVDIIPPPQKEEELTDSNLLTASAGDFNKSSNSSFFIEVIKNFLRLIEQPFLWLFKHLSF